jgi:ADP-ribosyl-[dinitrogen reductase] hydrolase
MVAARLLVELGSDPHEAICLVRKARPGANETAAQAQNVVQQKYVAEPHPAPDRAADRAMGALLGLAVGDAVGTTLEFSSRDSYLRHVDMIGGGPFRLRAGQWTDDTALALALADSLLAKNGVNEADLMTRFTKWWEQNQEGPDGCAR